jgi:hypothetical protein
MGLADDQVAKIRLAGLLHDVGKINTPAIILHKAGRLDDAEFQTIKLHPVDGAEMVSILGDQALTLMVRHHHERLDGHGYPNGLSAEQIPLGARIIAVADTFDAITSARPYRRASQHKRAMDILAAESGTQLDPAAVQAFERQYAGHRPFMIWVALTNFPERVMSLLGGTANAATVSAAGVMAVTAASGAVASAAAVQIVPLTPSKHVDNASVTGSAPVRRDFKAKPGQEARTPANQRSLAATAKGSSKDGGSRGGDKRDDAHRPSGRPAAAASEHHQLQKTAAIQDPANTGTTVQRAPSGSSFKFAPE